MGQIAEIVAIVAIATIAQSTEEGALIGTLIAYIASRFLPEPFLDTQQSTNASHRSLGLQPTVH